MGEVLKIIGLNRRLLFWGRFYFAIIILVIFLSFFNQFNPFFYIRNNKIIVTAYYLFFFFTINITIVMILFVDLILKLKMVRQNHIYIKLLKAMAVGSSIFIMTSILSILQFMIWGWDATIIVPITLPGTLTLAVVAFIFMSETLIHSFNKRQKISLFLNEADIHSKIDGAFNKVIDQIKREKLYLNPDITLKNLAKDLNIKRNELSKMINDHTESNFNNFINQLRLEAFCEEFVDEKNQDKSVLELALDCGFNSKATFNRVFKEVYKMSPKKYRETVLEKK